MSNVIHLKPTVTRSFLRRQAVLNAAEEHFTWCVQRYGIVEVLLKIESASEAELAYFCDEVRLAYRILTDTYREQPDQDDCAFTDPDVAAAVNGAFP